MKKYDHKKIEKKWQEEWEKGQTYRATEDNKKEKKYILDMLPYPSGAGLHVGHPRGYVGTDVHSRYLRMKGYSVLHPMGWDAFGLPAENYALKTKTQPRKSVDENIVHFRRQLQNIGLGYDWSREVDTTDPAYFKWTQWTFIKMCEAGLAYESEEPINWCPSCKTGLANEDLEKGRCERCESLVVKKPIRQWVLKITDYADRMLEDLGKLEWPEFIKEMQRNWIGRSEGMLFTANVRPLSDSRDESSGFQIQTYSAHYETSYSDMYVVIASDHPILAKLIDGVDNEEEIRAKIEDINVKRLEGGYAGPEDVEGVFTGRYLDDPLGNGDLPIWVASFAIADYGTGIVKCSAHDKRDFAFAQKYKIPIKVGMVSMDKEIRQKELNQELCHDDFTEGELLLPIDLTGTPASEARQKVGAHLKKHGHAKPATMYRLKDWVFSRQRYWGEPIPIIHCEGCGPVAVPEAELPVELPEVEHYEPTGTGESPLATIESWVNVKCPRCDGPGKRETNTMPQWAGSSWYYLRYMDPHNHEHLVDKKVQEYWNTTDMYVGGVEHATRHLIYARFWHKFLFDIGVVTYDEPFGALKGIGLIHADDGRKMGKRYGNVVNPDDVIDRFGADAFRTFEMFLGPFTDPVNWSTDGIMGPRRFIERVWRLKSKVAGDGDDAGYVSLLHKTIKKVTEDIEEFRLNTAVSALMELGNAFEKADIITDSDYGTFLKLIAPFAPHITEEIWHELGHKTSIHLESWPEYDEGKVIEPVLHIAVQIDGKVRDTVLVSPDADEVAVKETALGSEKVQKWLGGKTPKQIRYIPGRILSITT